MPLRFPTATRRRDRDTTEHGDCRPSVPPHAEENAGRSGHEARKRIRIRRSSDTISRLGRGLRPRSCDPRQIDTRTLAVLGAGRGLIPRRKLAIACGRLLQTTGRAGTVVLDRSGGVPAGRLGAAQRAAGDIIVAGGSLGGEANVRARMEIGRAAGLSECLTGPTRAEQARFIRHKCRRGRQPEHSGERPSTIGGSGTHDGIVLGIAPTGLERQFDPRGSHTKGQRRNRMIGFQPFFRCWNSAGQRDTRTF